MPEDDEKRRSLNRLLWRDRLKSLALPAAILIPTAALVAVFALPGPEVGEAELATVISTALQARDDTPRRMISIRLADGSGAVVSARPLVSPAPGEEICVVRVRQPVIRRITVRLAQPGACGP